MPAVTMEWLDLSDENTMFSPTIQEKGVSQWECKQCPWWLEYPIGVIPKQELELRAKFVEETSIEPIHQQAATSTQGDDADEGDREDVVEEVGDRDDVREEVVVEEVGDGKNGHHNTEPDLSFVVESSIISQSNSQRRPITRQLGFQYVTIVDALLVDVTSIDRFAINSINNFFSTQSNSLYSRRGVPCREVARLMFADFPTSLLVNGLGPLLREDLGKEIPQWNKFVYPLLMGTMDLAQTFLADEGFLVTLCLAQHVGEVITDASRVGLKLHRTWTFMCDGGYRHPDTSEQVVDLTVGLFYRASTRVPTYDRAAGERISTVLFPADRSYLCENHFEPTMVRGVPIRGGAERSQTFFRWLLLTFTEKSDFILDVFAGCGGLGVASSEEARYCMCLESDPNIFEDCLMKVVCGPHPCDGEEDV